MAKKETTTTEVEATVPEASASVVILTAPTREELAEKTATFIADHEGETLTFGAVGRSKDDGTYSQRIDII